MLPNLYIHFNRKTAMRSDCLKMMNKKLSSNWQLPYIKKFECIFHQIKTIGLNGGLRYAKICMIFPSFIKMLCVWCNRCWIWSTKIQFIEKPFYILYICLILETSIEKLYGVTLIYIYYFILSTHLYIHTWSFYDARICCL